MVLHGLPHSASLLTIFSAKIDKPSCTLAGATACMSARETWSNRRSDASMRSNANHAEHTTLMLIYKVRARGPRLQETALQSRPAGGNAGRHALTPAFVSPNQLGSPNQPHANPRSSVCVLWFDVQGLHAWCQPEIEAHRTNTGEASAATASTYALLPCDSGVSQRLSRQHSVPRCGPVPSQAKHHHSSTSPLSCSHAAVFRAGCRGVHGVLRNI